MSRTDPATRTATRPRPAPRPAAGAPARASVRRRPRPATNLDRSVRAAIPFTLLPLGLGATAVAGAPWLRVFPASVMAVPLFGAAVLSVLVPVVVIGIGVRRLWLTALIDIVLFGFYALLVGLHEPTGFADLWQGLAHGPAQILSYGLPLVSPRTLLVAPLALCWVGGAVLGECIGRAWHSVLPYATLLVVFGLSYGGSARGITSTSTGRREDTLLGALLLVLLLLMRAVQAWTEQQLEADSAQSDSALPLRGLGYGTAVAVVVALIMAGVGQASVLGGPPASAVRTPSLARNPSSTPLAFVAGLRPADYGAAGHTLFSVRLSRPTSRYLAVADVDSYDGSGWSFHRTFLPSGGLLAGEPDSDLTTSGPSVTQTYAIGSNAFAGTHWMPFLFRPQQVTGQSVDSDATSGMIVATRSLRAGQHYVVRSAATPGDVADLRASAQVVQSVAQQYLNLNAAVKTALGSVVSGLQKESGAASRNGIVYLQALTKDLQEHYGLSGEAARGTQSPGAGPTPASSSSAVSSGPSATVPSTDGTGFATMLTSILGSARAASPEQYATLVALIARYLGVPSRVVTGFRLDGLSGSSPTVAAGSYRVTTADAWTWVEIPIEGRGWVVLDASPTRLGHESPLPSSSQTPAVATGTRSVAPGSLAPSGLGRGVLHRNRLPGTPGHAVAITLLVIAVVILLVALTLAALLVRKRLRTRRRRTAPDPRQRLVGAWQESLDVLVESGLPEVQALTSTEIAERTLGRFGDEPAEQVRRLGRGANAAIFNPSAPIDPQDADAAWTEHDTLRRSVLKRLSLRDRLESELRYHRPSRRRPARGSEPGAARVQTAPARARHATSGRRRGH